MVLPREVVEVGFVKEAVSVLQVEEGDEAETNTSADEAKLKNFPKLTHVHHQGHDEEDREDPQVHGEPKPNGCCVHTLGLHFVKDEENEQNNQRIRTPPRGDV